MKKLIALLLSLILVLSFIGCGDNGKTDDPVSPGVESPTDNQQVEEVTKDEEPTKKADQVLQNVPDSILPLYPNAELIHSDERRLTYATDASAKDVLEFYEENTQITVLMTSVGYYLLGTEFYDVTRQDFANTDERRAIIDKYFEDAGGKAVREFMILEKQMADEAIRDLFGDDGGGYFGKTLIEFVFIDYYM